jgi:hypothetical protein
MAEQVEDGGDVEVEASAGAAGGGAAAAAAAAAAWARKLGPVQRVRECREMTAAIGRERAPGWECLLVRTRGLSMDGFPAALKGSGETAMAAAARAVFVHGGGIVRDAWTSTGIVLVEPPADFSPRYTSFELSAATADPAMRTAYFVATLRPDPPASQTSGNTMTSRVSSSFQTRPDSTACGAIAAVDGETTRRHTLAGTISHPGSGDFKGSDFKGGDNVRERGRMANARMSSERLGDPLSARWYPVQDALDLQTLRQDRKALLRAAIPRLRFIRSS